VNMIPPGLFGDVRVKAWRDQVVLAYTVEDGWSWSVDVLIVSEIPGHGYLLDVGAFSGLYQVVESEWKFILSINHSIWKIRPTPRCSLKPNRDLRVSRVGVPSPRRRMCTWSKNSTKRGVVHTEHRTPTTFSCHA
jgi:hypothetical protein